MPWFYTLFLIIECSKNTAEYDAIIIGFELALQVPIANLMIYRDFELVIKQLQWGVYHNKSGVTPFHNGVEKLLR